MSDSSVANPALAGEYSHNPEVNKMQIILDQQDIEKAIKQHVVSHVTPQPNAQIEIKMRAGRGENGFSATVDITSPSPSKKPAATPGPVQSTQTFEKVADEAHQDDAAGAASTGKSIFGSGG